MLVIRRVVRNMFQMLHSEHAGEHFRDLAAVSDAHLKAAAFFVVAVPAKNCSTCLSSFLLTPTFCRMVLQTERGLIGAFEAF